MNARGTEHVPRARRTTTHNIPSPLDPFLRRFLGWVSAHDGGLNPTRELQVIAEEFDWQPSFVEVLFTAARSRGLLHPVPTRGSRSKIDWRVTPQGTEWLETPDETPGAP
jgi:hypothetical protein